MKKVVAGILMSLNVILRIVITKNPAAAGVYTLPGLIVYAIVFSITVPLILIALGLCFRRNRNKEGILILFIIGSIITFVMNVL